MPQRLLPLRTPSLERSAFLLLLGVLTCAFLGLLLPFFGALLWAVALAMLFHPLYRRLGGALHKRRNGAAVLTVLIVLVAVVVPLAIVGVVLVQDLLELTTRIRSGEIDFASIFQRMTAATPDWMVDLLNRIGLDDPAAAQQRLQDLAANGSQTLATGALSVGQNTLSFLISCGVMLYLLFFLLRDGRKLSAAIRRAMPLSRQHAHHLLNRLTIVTRATVKGNVIVAAVQGTLGGVAMAVLGVQGALLWGVLMAIFSLLPAIGAAIIWGPAALYLFATGAVWQSVALVAFGTLVVGSVDNVLRPILVGRDTQMPDYVVLLSTIGGIALVGINGFVVGPVIAALFMTAWQLFADSRSLPERVHATRDATVD
ncbi:MAG: AI-2E family transporter [Gemmatimonadota bacterium]